MEERLYSFNDLVPFYIRMTDPVRLLPHFERTAATKRVKTDVEGFFWLYYASLLLGCRQKDRAAEILADYRCGLHGLAGVARFPALAELAEEIGIADDRTLRSAAVYRHLEAAEKGRFFEKAVRAKRVAIVGNSQSEIGKGSGGEIDQHDVVIRFNNYAIDGFERDYGTRTDMWIRGFGFVEVMDRSADEAYSFSGISGDYHYHPFCSEGQCDILYRDLVKRRIPCGYFDPVGYRRMHRCFAGEPTTGLVTIYSCLRFGARCVDCYGFSFQEVKPSFSHYFFKNEDSSAYRGLRAVHDLSAEQVYLARLTRDIRWQARHLPRMIRKWVRPGNVWERFSPKLSFRD